jgi:RNA polymerase sigma factor (sigma-70 family)
MSSGMTRLRATREEIERLYRDQFPKFVRVAETILRDRERARDAVQEGFANALRAASTFRGQGALDAWVWRCVVNAARVSARRPQELHAVIDAGAPDPESLFGIAPLISSLPERQRLVVFLRYYVGLDYRQIAEAMEIEIGTVSATLAASHAALRKRLKEAEAHAGC